MTTATLSAAPATQLTFPWLNVEDDAHIVAESPARLSDVAGNSQPSIGMPLMGTAIVAKAIVVEPQVEEVAPSLTAALNGDRIGRPFKMGSVMFRLLKSYGITDEEIAAGSPPTTQERRAAKQRESIRSARIFRATIVLPVRQALWARRPCTFLADHELGGLKGLETAALQAYIMLVFT